MAINKGIITFELEGLDDETVMRYHEMLDLIIRNGVLNVKNGKVILNFDSQGVLQEMEFQVKKYRRRNL
jgi:hypothetical protein